jgi:hypothetical protein
MIGTTSFIPNFSIKKDNKYNAWRLNLLRAEELVQEHRDAQV